MFKLGSIKSPYTQRWLTALCIGIRGIAELAPTRDILSVERTSVRGS